MSELKPLDIVDDRTLEQIRADGDDRWPSGRPYIRNGICCVCERVTPPNEVAGPIPLHVCLVQLSEPVPCGTHLLVQEEQHCTGLAYWASGVEGLTPLCDECIVGNCTPDNCEWFLLALVDIAERNAGRVIKFEIPVPCEIHLLAQKEQRCTGLASWRVSGFAECDECIVRCLEQHPDSRECLAAALEDIRKRHLKIGARVRLQCLFERGNLGVIEKPNWNGNAWYVRVDRRGPDGPPIVCCPDELDVVL